MILFRRAAARILAALSLLCIALTTKAEAITRTGAAVVTEALRFRGVRYRWGGLSRRGVDCSGLTLLVYRKLGVRLPRTARQQAKTGRAVRRGAEKVGDLLFFRTRRGQHTHVGIYVGNGKMIHAPRTGKRVSVVSIRGYFAARISAVRRAL